MPSLSLSDLPETLETSLSQAQRQQTLDWVGMTGIAIQGFLGIDQQTYPVHCRLDCGVDLPTPDKGIHMSRLYQLVQQKISARFDFSSIAELCQQLCQSQSLEHQSSSLRLAFDLALARSSLRSDQSAQQSYPITLVGRQHQHEFQLELQVQVDYSSTCPCSAALSRQLIAKQFAKDFNAQTINKQHILDWLENQKVAFATPHSQRSTATVTVLLNTPNNQESSIIALIDGIEQTLKTPVQTIVKRTDEQVFAQLNGNNLMFCEDAARRLKYWLKQCQSQYGFSRASGQVEHFESLHKHNAVARFSIH